MNGKIVLARIKRPNEVEKFLFKALLKPWDQVEQESDHVSTTAGMISVWHPYGKHLTLGQSDKKYFGGYVWTYLHDKIATIKGFKHIYYVYHKDRSGKGFTAYDYWFQYIENGLVATGFLEDSLFEI
jgi:hypothetical protein